MTNQELQDALLYDAEWFISEDLESPNIIKSIPVDALVSEFYNFEEMPSMAYDFEDESYFRLLVREAIKENAS